LPSRAHGVGNVGTAGEPFGRNGEQKQPVAAVSGADIGCTYA
jgi:hypothetical protein